MPVTRHAFFTSEFLAQLERLSLLSRRIFRGRVKGERRSLRRGHSVEFCDYRAYGVPILDQGNEPAPPVGGGRDLARHLVERIAAAVHLRFAAHRGGPEHFEIAGRLESDVSPGARLLVPGVEREFR